MFKAIINTNVFISFAAVVLTLGTGLQYGSFSNLWIYLLLIFFATLADYNWHRYIKVIFNKRPNSKYSWATEHLRAILSIAIISSIGIGAVAFFLPPEIINWLIVLGVCTAIYSLPLHTLGMKGMDVRKIPALKTLLITFTWTLATLFLPYLLTNNSFGDNITFSLVERSLFIFAITVPFDVKDIKEDQRSGWKTLPVLLGKKTSMQISQVALSILILSSAIQLFTNSYHAEFIAAFSTGIYSLIILNAKKLRAHKYYYPLFIDGAILLYGLLLIGLHLII